MKDVLIRSVFGALFLMVVFTPFVYDVRNDANLMNLVFFTFTMLGTHELFEMGKKSPFQNTLKLPALILVVALFIPLLIQTLAHFYPAVSNTFWHLIIESPLLFILWGILVLAIGVFCYWIFKKENIDFVFKRTFIFNFFYPVLPMWVLAMAYTFTNNFDKQILLVVLLPIYLNDTLAYVSGRIFGKHLLLPGVSPKKTWEGFAGGLLGAALVMLAILYFAGHFNALNAIAVAVISILASILATLGDLFESKLKRSIHIKDSGNILPGHGGILDRIDAMLFVAPVLYVLLALIS
ncbi:phosphatidate cytidylyltransferase [Fluviicola sp.]|jgi:phosphatidate cytidylyltransferase|uniref:phosphatidate cytidylyltransferase n=1 Tax=Fluviicola sp. TaxID=1917219 RepID=UPI00281FFCBF|nr:phosphatidate cytidylyltransferase [Fluviicola sp.]MDR0801185.1 phosphatidate cytidylyltransferase [Fluviicola sp.]